MENKRWIGPAIGIAAIAVLLLIISFATRNGTPRTKPGQPDPDRNQAQRDRDEQRPKELRTEPTITLYNAKTGKVERIKMEEYVAGVVAAEMDVNWPKQALAAQSILARTFTLQKMSQGKTRHGTDASTDVKEFQAYAPEKINDSVREAVRSTRGMAVTYQGRYIRAYFHSCAGGMTSTAAEGLDFRREPTPYLEVVKDPPCENPAQQNWSATFSKEEVIRAAAKMGVRLNSVRSVNVGNRGPSGRAQNILINGTPISAAGFRVAIGPDRLKSTLWESVRLQGNSITIKGRGWGHGVGMSQYGALDKARKGWTAERIINYYFKDVEIKRLWR